MNTAIYQQTGFGHLTDLPCIKLQYGNASAVVSLYGGQVLSYQPTPGRELLWLSPLASWHNQTPIRGGVPVCWPWFGPAEQKLNPQQQALPNHGVVRTQLWQLSEQTETPQGVSLTLAVTVKNLAHYQAEVTLKLKLTLSDTLSMTLQCDTTMLQQAALHSYFAVDNIAQTQVSSLPQTYIDKLSGKTEQVNTDTAQFSAEVDRVYLSPAAELKISDNQKIITVAQLGQDASVVWNPWQQKSRQTKDLPDDSYQRFVCVETARLLLDSALPLTLTQQLRGN